MINGYKHCQSEVAYSCVDELGAIGVVEFRDLNPEVNILQRKFINEVVRCAEMERKLKFVMKEINRAGIKVSGTTGCESIRCSPRRGSSVGRARHSKGHSITLLTSRGFEPRPRHRSRENILAAPSGASDISPRFRNVAKISTWYSIKLLAHIILESILLQSPVNHQYESNDVLFQ